MPVSMNVPFAGAHPYRQRDKIFRMHVNSNRTAGFTVLELLVVISIIAVLSAALLATFSIARRKSRDASRAADFKSLQVALELYYSANSDTYPDDLSSLVPAYIPAVPADPSLGDAAYGYVQSAPLGYVLGAIMENPGQTSILTSDYDGVEDITINGVATNCDANAGLPIERVYCRIP